MLHLAGVSVQFGGCCWAGRRWRAAGALERSFNGDPGAWRRLRGQPRQLASFPAHVFVLCFSLCLYVIHLFLIAKLLLVIGGNLNQESLVPQEKRGASGLSLWTEELGC